MQLSTIEYDAIMQAINNQRDALQTDGIDPYNNETGYTETQLISALNRVENRTQSANVPT